MLLQFVTSSMLHLISMHVESCWCMSISCMWNISYFCFYVFFLCKPLRCPRKSVGNIHEVSSRLMTWSYQYGRNYRSLSDLLSFDSYRGMPNADSGVGVATKMFSKSSRKHVEQSKSKGQKSRQMRSESAFCQIHLTSPEIIWKTNTCASCASIPH